PETLLSGFNKANTILVGLEIWTNNPISAFQFLGFEEVPLTGGGTRKIARVWTVGPWDPWEVQLFNDGDGWQFAGSQRFFETGFTPGVEYDQGTGTIFLDLGLFGWDDGWLAESFGFLPQSGITVAGDYIKVTGNGLEFILRDDDDPEKRRGEFDLFLEITPEILAVLVDNSVFTYTRFNDNGTPDDFSDDIEREESYEVRMPKAPDAMTDVSTLPQITFPLASDFSTITSDVTVTWTLPFGFEVSGSGVEVFWVIENSSDNSQRTESVEMGVVEGVTEDATQFTIPIPDSLGPNESVVGIEGVDVSTNDVFGRHFSTELYAN
ncbi:MAG: hypothetical protein IID61_14505, partial [SAR324 cluster bacterium]|nr:hypothetical protein [SAR324 cluster bacterium]